MEAASVAANNLSGGIILCGGRSSRMGSDKADLQIGAQTFLQRIASVVAQCVDHIVLVAAQGQNLPALSLPCLTILRDSEPFEGPLPAFIAGMDALPNPIKQAFVISCDLPLIDPELIRILLAQFEQRNHESSKCQIAIPIIQGHPQVLCAVYDRSVAMVGREMLKQGSRRMRDLLDHCTVQGLSEMQLIELGASERTWISVNTPEEYARLLSELSTWTADGAKP